VGPVAAVRAGDTEWFRIDDESTIGAARRAAVRMANAISFSASRAGEAAIVVTEVATNLHRHAANGALMVRVQREGDVAGLGIVAVDSGPGMSDPQRSAGDGFSTAGTLGIGLGAIERLSSWSDSISVPGEGTVLASEIWEGRAPLRPQVAWLTRAIANEDVCGDAIATSEDDGRIVVLVVDGLGHGPLAAQAANVAVRAFDEHARAAAGVVVTALHRALAGTRGAALAVADIDARARSVTYAGIGNVAGWIVDESGRRGMVSMPGIAGHKARRVQEWRYDLSAGARVVLHSDGLTDKWVAGPALWSRDPILAAGVLLRDAGTRHDDASVVVAEVPWTS
jgi:anti-sigma regulatory factor (Ser/Thr protein kinase)